MALLSLQDVTVGFGGPPVLDGVTLRIEPGERIGLVGRNGAGKSTLMRLIQEDIPFERGDVIRSQGLAVAMLAQEVPSDLAGSVFDEVAKGMGPVSELLTKYHHASVEYAASHDEPRRLELERLEQQLDVEGGWQTQQRVDRVLSRMDLPPEAACESLSAGMKRRVLLAKALVREPDILLLDEPTNHLDIEAIRWLEDFLLKFDKTVLLITHDRMFLRKLATRIVEIDRGRLTSWECDHATYLVRKQAALDAEAKQDALFDKKLAQEEVWIRTGIKARRTRNEGRVRALEALRLTRQARRERPGKVEMQAVEAEKSGRLVIEAKNVTFAYSPDKPPVIRDLSTAVMRGDKVGILGPNGSGKTTLLRLLLGELTAVSGTVRQGTRLEIAYFDQLHAQLDEDKSVIDNVTDGSDRITVGGKSRHVVGYLEDFLFSPEKSRRAVKFLSGGERNRLLLARLFTKPSNVLVLDEPTNDLDLETLELLEELLAEYQGTVLLVSHDREFLNNVASSILVIGAGGEVREYPGGYDDWARQTQAQAQATKAESVAPAKPVEKPTQDRTQPARPRKLSFKEQKELESLTAKIGKLEAEQADMHAKMADPAFYRQSGPQIAEGTTRLSVLEAELSQAYERWEELESLR